MTPRNGELTACFGYQEMRAGMRTLLILLATVAVIAILSHERMPITGSKRFGKNNAEKIGKRTITAMLKAPNGAKFPGMFDDGKGAFKREDGLWEAYGWVDAQSSSGAMAREDWRVIMDENEKVWFAKLGSHTVGQLPGTTPVPARISNRESTTSRSEKEIRSQWGWDTSGSSLNRPAHSQH